ncbi:hypothetical protein EMIHUDRAFT_448423 [Emiliania huxleyi CCMP1516]|uniref:Heat shock protein 70 n=2 Tax=Emiliania huxleyi TaxID=2903 RepID=A0A0D3IEB6_EMIH1|nr:hypothetical protein EMIHUDRAFT_448423 [Emiliania huxleyi CCMP1516]EOD09601.1 hypothetical protein EMIHUDRAFT_448423 [Emiliania huxleyi CCMP1516]|eukprot:XP_005762030.1 hypothetical protein EMIHUDRAFT_448423 [Emiliania huxleyi CCMP1516]
MIFFSLICVLLAASVQHMLPSPPVTAVGIDLGTTFSCIATFNDGEVEVVVNAEGSTITPSVLFVPEDGSDLVVGEYARAAAARQNGTLLYDAKRLIGKRFDAERLAVEAAELPFEVGAHIVRRLRAAAERRVGAEVRLAVLAVPVGFARQQIEATREAAMLAGFEVMRTIHEPTAAAMAYGLHEGGGAGGSLTVLVYDMGGGTLDVSLLLLTNGIFEVVAAAGDNRLGGQDFSAAMLDELVARASTAAEVDETAVRADRETMRAMREEAERVKADCAGVFYDGDIGATISLDLPPRLAAAAPLALSRADYEAMPRVTELFERSMAPVAQVLARAGVAAAEVGKMMEPNCAVSPEEAAAILTDRKRISVGATEAALHGRVAGDVER